MMRAIDFELGIRREEDPSGDRVVVTYNGKCFPSKKREEGLPSERRPYG